MVDKINITNNFSRYAHLYDQYADIQKQAALKLIDTVKHGNFCKILELGCGTGNYSILLRERFKAASIKALDISESMISVARDKLKHKDVELIVADAQNMSLHEDFDLVTSNACFQWFDDLGEVLREYAKLLQKQGTLLFSIFGPYTFSELNTALTQVLKEERITATHFYDRDSLKAILQEHFKSVKISEINYQENFVSLKELLEKIKYSGIRGNGLTKKIYFSRGLLDKLDRAYRDSFQEIRATYQIFLCQGEKR